MACTYTIGGKTYADEQAFKAAVLAEPSLIAEHVGVKDVPSAPFIGKTEDWANLAMRRMVRYAAENGFDRLAWTRGEQQAARYDLSKQIDSISFNRLNRGQPTEKVAISFSAASLPM